MRSTSLLFFTVMASFILAGSPLPVREVILRSRNDTDSTLLPNLGGSSNSRLRNLLPRPAGQSHIPAVNPASVPVVTFIDWEGQPILAGPGKNLNIHERRELTEYITYNVFGKTVADDIDPVYIGLYEEDPGTPDSNQNLPNWVIFELEYELCPKCFGFLAWGPNFVMGPVDPATGLQKAVKKNRSRNTGRGGKRYVAITHGPPARNRFIEQHEDVTYGQPVDSSRAITIRMAREWQRIIGVFNAKFMVPAPALPGPPVHPMVPAM